jgi:DNA replication and repair protein RecF
VYVRHLSLVDFRSWAGVELVLEAGPAVFVGANGRGKTNLVEAVGYLATLRSHRSATEAPLVRIGAERAIVRAAVVSHDADRRREMRVEVEITPGRANRARVNGAMTTRSASCAPSSSHPRTSRWCGVIPRTAVASSMT